MFYGEPKYLAATSARKLCGIKIPKGQKAKAVSLQFVVDNVPGFDVQYTRYGIQRLATLTGRIAMS